MLFDCMEALHHKSPDFPVAKTPFLLAFNKYYNDNNIGSKRFRKNLVRESAHALCRLMANLRFSLLKHDEKVLDTLGFSVQDAEAMEKIAEKEPEHPDSDPLCETECVASGKTRSTATSTDYFEGGSSKRRCLQFVKTKDVESWSDFEFSQPNQQDKDETQTNDTKDKQDLCHLRGQPKDLDLIHI